MVSTLADHDETPAAVARSRGLPDTQTPVSVATSAFGSAAECRRCR